MARVAVIVPAYNCANFILLTLKYATTQTFKDLQVIVVDDGSTDNLTEVLQDCPATVKVITQQNGGMSAARNRGISDSDSEFIALLDADDVWHLDKVAAQVRLLEQNPQWDLSFGEFKIWNDNQPVCFSGPTVSMETEPTLSGWIYHQMILTCWALPSTLMFRRSVFDGVGPFLQQDSKTDDWEWMIRASRVHQFAKLRDCLTLYRQHSNQLSRKLPVTDVTALMRERMISKYGLTGPDGRWVDAVELDRRRYSGLLSFSSSHFGTGNVPIALAHARRAIEMHPAWPHGYLLTPKGLMRRGLNRLGKIKKLRGP